MTSFQLPKDLLHVISNYTTGTREYWKNKFTKVLSDITLNVDQHSLKLLHLVEEHKFDASKIPVPLPTGVHIYKLIPREICDYIDYLANNKKFKYIKNTFMNDTHMENGKCVHNRGKCRSGAPIYALPAWHYRLGRPAA